MHLNFWNYRKLVTIHFTFDYFAAKLKLNIYNFLAWPGKI